MEERFLNHRQSDKTTCLLDLTQKSKEMIGSFYREGKVITSYLFRMP